MHQKPNILLILSDQHHARVLGCAGDPLVRTPNLDRLAARGVRFADTSCPSPLCVPSRMAFLTGRRPSANRVWTNACVLDANIPTFAHSLGAGGYETVLAGRMHFVGPDQSHGFTSRLVGDVIGQYLGGNAPDLGEWGLQSAGQSHQALERTGPGGTSYMAYDAAVSDAACDWLRRRGERTDGQPFLLLVGYVLPHSPYVCPSDRFVYYSDRLAERDPLPADVLRHDPAAHPAVVSDYKARGYDRLTAAQIERARAAYYGMVDTCDAEIGRVLAALQASGLERETIVVYVSDHGEMAGEHGYWAKSTLYQGAVAVPMIWTWPGHFPAGAVSQRVANLLDIAPTLVDLTGSPPLPAMAGHSLAPQLRGDAVEPDADGETCAEILIGAETPARMIRRGPWKLNYYDGYEDVQLFNLTEDPYEQRDLGSDPGHAGVREDLKRRLLANWAPEEIRATIQERRSTWPLLVEWCRKTRPHDAVYWPVPAGANVRAPEAVS